MLYFVLYNVVSFYTTFIAQYEKWIREPFGSAYKTLYSEKIVSIRGYNVKTKTKQKVYSISTSQVMYDIVCYYMGVGADKGGSQGIQCIRGLDLFIPTTDAKNIIYEITTWEGAEYYIKGCAFYMDARPAPPKNKSKFLFVGLNNKHDVTQFFNKHSNSFTQKNAITVTDFVSFAMLKGICDYESYTESLDIGFAITFVTCDETLQGHTYKDNDTLVFQ